MQKKITLTIDEEVYDGLREVIGPRKISHFVEELVRPHVVRRDLYAAYREMAADRVREAEALEWAEGTCGDVSEAYVTFRGKRSKAMADPLTTISKRRLLNKAGEVAPGEMEGMVRAITIQLGL